MFPQGLTSRDTPSPVDPDTVEVLMTFEPDPADLALSSIPGHETFDPRRHRFSEEELKPQPIMKKARKIQVPEEQKVRATGRRTQNWLTQAPQPEKAPSSQAWVLIRIISQVHLQPRISPPWLWGTREQSLGLGLGRWYHCGMQTQPALLDPVV